MKILSKIAVTAAVAMAAVGGGAAAASAYSISGGTFSGVAASGYTFSLGGGAYTISCPTTSISGSATGTDTMTVTPAIDGCTFFGFPFSVTQTGAWNVTVTGNVGGTYTGELEIPAGVTTTTSSPFMGCTIVLAGPQTFRGSVNSNIVQLDNWGSGTGADLTLLANGFAYTATGCPFSSGADGNFDFAGPISIPGITVS